MFGAVSIGAGFSCPCTLSRIAPDVGEGRELPASDRGIPTKSRSRSAQKVSRQSGPLSREADQSDRPCAQQNLCLASAREMLSPLPSPHDNDHHSRSRQDFPPLPLLEGRNSPGSGEPGLCAWGQAGGGTAIARKMNTRKGSNSSAAERGSTIVQVQQRSPAAHWHVPAGDHYGLSGGFALRSLHLAG